MRVASQTWNNASTYGPYCERFFFLMKHEPAERRLWALRLLSDYMRTVESRSTGPQGGNERYSVKGGTELQASIEGA